MYDKRQQMKENIQAYIFGIVVLYLMLTIISYSVGVRKLPGDFIYKGITDPDKTVMQYWAEDFEEATRLYQSEMNAYYSQEK